MLPGHPAQVVQPTVQLEVTQQPATAVQLVGTKRAKPVVVSDDDEGEGSAHTVT